MHLLFSDVLWAVLAVGVLASIWAMAGASKQWQHYGERGMFMESARAREQPTPSATVAAAERISEIRQMVEAANARRARRGEAELDVEAEILRLTAAPEPTGTAAGQNGPRQVDPEVEDEVRMLVELRNQRRVRKGQAPLDVEAEIQRELTALGLTDR